MQIDVRLTHVLGVFQKDDRGICSPQKTNSHHQDYRGCFFLNALFCLSLLLVGDVYSLSIGISVRASPSVMS